MGIRFENDYLIAHCIIHTIIAYIQARAEVDSFLKDKGGNRGFDFEDMSSLPYIQAFLMENMRLFPASPAFNRETTEDTFIDGRPVPAKVSASELVPMPRKMPIPCPATPSQNAFLFRVFLLWEALESFAVSTRCEKNIDAACDTTHGFSHDLTVECATAFHGMGCGLIADCSLDQHMEY